MRLGTVLRKWRLTAERKQKDVAAEIGISDRALARIEAGATLPQIDSETLSRVLNWMCAKEDPTEISEELAA